MEHHASVINGLRLHYVSAGAATDPLVVLLHGFPARWSTWQMPMAGLAQAGFHAVAPDLRGYGDSAKPRGVRQYTIDRLADDVVALIHELGNDRAYIVGHDFGGGIAWAAAMFHPHAVKGLAILNSAHPLGFASQIRRRSQLRKSWYMFFFQIPWLPEVILSRHDFEFLRRALANDGLSQATIADLLEGVSPDGALCAAINWYRAAFRDGLTRRLQPRRVTVPTLLVWGDRERYLDSELADPPAEWVSHTRTEHIPTAGHWVHHDAPERVTTLLIHHISAIERSAT